MEITKEQLLLENLISSKDLFSTCINLIKPQYFENPEHRGPVIFLKEYFELYKAIPSPDTIEAETGRSYKLRTVTSDAFKYSCDAIEDFCKCQAMKEAIQRSALEINKPDCNMGSIYESVKKALMVQLPKRIGIEFYSNPEDRLRSYIESQQYTSTGINALNSLLDGGLMRQTFTLILANSGVGKSIMLANLGVNLSKQGLNVLYIALELNERMIDLRLSSIATHSDVAKWQENISDIAFKISKMRENGSGTYVVYRMENGSCANDIRAYLKLYELEYGYLPDALILDYLDLMDPNPGTVEKGMGEHKIDKLKTEQLNSIIFEINAIGLSASQNNRSGVGNLDPDQATTGGGLNKIFTVDTALSLVMTTEMRLQGQMKIKSTKMRSGKNEGQAVIVSFNPDTLVISDGSFTEDEIVKPTLNVDGKKYKPKSKADEIMNDIKIKNMPKPVQQEKTNDLLDFLETK